MSENGHRNYWRCEWHCHNWVVSLQGCAKLSYVVIPHCIAWKAVDQCIYRKQMGWMKFKQLRTMSLEQHHVNNSQYVYTASQTIIAETFNSESGRFSSYSYSYSYSNNQQTWASTNLSLSSLFMIGSKSISEVKLMGLLTAAVVLTDKGTL